MGSCAWGKSFQIVKIAWFLGVCSSSSDDLGTPSTCSISKSGLMLAPPSPPSFFCSFSSSVEPSQISTASRIELWTHSLWSLSHLFGNELSLGGMMSPTLCVFRRRGWLYSWGVGTLLYPEWPYLYLCLCLGLANSFLYTHTHTHTHTLIVISGILLYLAQFPLWIASSNFSLRKTSLILESELQNPPWYSQGPSTTYTRS